jgi:ATP-binding cassette subfamily B protein
MGLIIRFWREYARVHLISYVLGVIFLLCTNGLGVLIPRLIQWSIDALERSESAMGLALALLGAGVGTMIVRTLSRTLIFNPGRTIEYTLKNDLFAHLLRLPRAFYERDMSAGEMINRGTNDTAAVRGLVGYGSLQLFNVVFTLTLTLSQMFLINATLSLWCVIPLGFAVFVLRWAVLKMFAMQKLIVNQVGVLGDRILESYAGVGLIQLFAARAGIYQRFDQENQAMLALSERLQTIAVWALPIVSVIGNICVVIALYIGGGMLTRGTLTIGELSAMIVYINLLVSCLTSLGWLTGAIQRGYISLGRVYEVIDTSVDRAQPSAGLQPCDDRGRGLEVRDLTFTHPTAHHESLSQISFNVAPGEMIGIFGLTGSGKSTLLDVLSRTYEPPVGTVIMDDVDVTQVDVETYWSEIGYVQQTPYLFSQSLRENIAIAGPRDPRSGEHDVLINHAVNTACLSDDIRSFPQGLDTRVGERGVTLSGGQKQRTSLARAFYRDDIRLLMLDDVMSAVDHHTEVQLIQAIYQRQPQCTTLIVSHRMSVLQEADRVLVFDQGRLIEEGAPHDLSQGDGLYAQAWRAQHDYTRSGDTIDDVERNLYGEVQS